MDEPGLRIASRAPVLEEGCRVAGRYRLGARIEKRSDRQSYEAWDELSGRWVQLAIQASPTVRDARLVHPGIAQREEVGCIGEWFVNVLDPGPGEGLARLIGRLGTETPLDLESLMIVGLGLCEALGHAGRWGLYHGNIGTRRIHVSPQLDPVLLGFPSHPGGPLSPSSIPFASPERLLGHEGDSRSDVYAIAGLLYTLRTGEPPFGWAAHTAREGHFYSPVGAHPRIPRPLMEVLQTAMEKPQRLRYPDPAAFATALTEAYQAAAGAWTDEEIPGIGVETTEEVALEEATAVQERPSVPTRDPGTVWEESARPPLMHLDLDTTSDDLFLEPELQAVGALDDQTIELGPDMLEDDMLEDRTLELGPEMLAEPSPRPRQTQNPMPLARRAPHPGAVFQAAPVGPPVRTANVRPSPPAPPPARSYNRPESMELYAEGPDDLYFEPMPIPHEAEWVDTLPPAREREVVLEEESLSFLLLAALSALVIGMAGAATVAALLLAQLTF